MRHPRQSLGVRFFRGVIPLPAPLRPVLAAIREAGGRPLLVGGCVRDALWGMDPGDLDVEVGQLSFTKLQAVLATFGATDVVGRSFGTIKLRRQGLTYDFSLPRRESKTGAGHRGFKVEPDPALSDAEAAARRDFTLNAMAWDPFAARLIDPHGGQADLQARRLRHTSPAFVEDPLRVLRAMQLAGRFNLHLAPETAQLCRTMVGAGAELPVERIWAEWDKWATRSTRPSQGLVVLQQTGWLADYPEIAALAGTPQEPEWHPEGDVLIHTQHCLDALVADAAWGGVEPERRRVLVFGVLAHDFGKPATTVRLAKHGVPRWSSPGHAVAGLAPTASFLVRIGAPLRLVEQVQPLVQHHLAHLSGGSGGVTDAQVRRLARKLAPATIADLLAVMRADARGRPPRDDSDARPAIDALAAKATDLALADAAPHPIVQGRHLVARGLAPGPPFTPILAAAYEAQLDGAFNDERTSSTWLDHHLNPPAN